MDGYLGLANSAVMYQLAILVVAFILVLSVVFLIRAYRRGIAIGMDKAKLSKAITSSATFTIVPSIGILIGVIALSGSLGVPLPWIRLTVIGALHYETMAADIGAKASGAAALDPSLMDIKTLVSVACIMTVGMIWGALFCVIGLKRYEKTLSRVSKKDSRLGEVIFSAMFIGLVSAYVASGFAGLRTGNYTAIACILVAAGAMALFQWLIDKRNQKWLESFALSFAMLIGMAASLIF